MNPILSIIEEIKHDAAGVAVLTDWLGSGGVPVGQGEAEARASVCKSGNSGLPCPQNVEPNWWDRVKHKVADAIRSHIEVQNRIGIHVSNESNLGMCRVCGCCLRLMVWVPVKTLAQHTSKEQLNGFPDYCWKRQQILSL